MRKLRWMLLIILALLLTVPSFSAAPAHPGIYTGMFLETGESPTEYGKFIGKRIAISMWFSSWNQGRTDMAVNLVKLNKKLGILSHVTWEPWTDLDSIIRGDFDAYIHRNAQAVAALKFPVMIRFAHEMNGDWYPWCGVKNGGETTNAFGDPALPDGPERYIAAYRHIHDIFVAEGATNVLWIWAPNVTSAPGADWNAAANYYPGDKYVDWIGIDGYNWGSSRPYGGWMSFDQIFGSSYSSLTQLIPDKPVIIAEFASTEAGGDKAAWIRDTFKSMRNYPRLRAFVWFNIIKETSWSIESSDESTAAFQKAVADPLFLDRFPGF